MSAVIQLQARSTTMLVCCTAPPSIDVSCNTAGIAVSKWFCLRRLFCFSQSIVQSAFFKLFYALSLSNDVYIDYRQHRCVPHEKQKNRLTFSSFLKLVASVFYQAILSFAEISMQASVAIISTYFRIVQVLGLRFFSNLF